MRALARLNHNDLPADATVVALRAREGLSILFNVSVDLVTETADLDLQKMLWSTACAAIARAAPPAYQRSFHGVIEEARYLGSTTPGTATACACVPRCTAGEAAELLDALVLAPDYVPFLTLAAYDRLD